MSGLLCFAIVFFAAGAAHLGYAWANMHGAEPLTASWWIGTACIVAAFGLVLCMVGKRRTGQ